MTKIEFLDELRVRLAGLTTDEREAALNFYEELFEERGSDKESELLHELGSPEEIAEKVIDGLSGNFVPDVVSKRAPKKPPLWLWILAIIVAFPAIITVFATTGSVLITIIAVFFGVLFALVAAVVALFISSLALVYIGITTLAISAIQALLYFGGAFITMGLTLLLFTPAILFTSGVIKWGSKLIRNLVNQLTGRRPLNEKAS